MHPWIAVLLWIGVIYASIPFVRQMRESFVSRWPAELIGWAVIVVVAAGATVGIGAARRRRHRIQGADLLWISGLAAILVVWTGRLMERPEEAVHIVEYGVLGLLLNRALRPRVRDAAVYPAAALIGVLAGIVDEIIQWLVPGRFFDFRDIVLNGSSVALVQIAAWRLAPPANPGLGRDSLRLLCRLAAAVVLVLTLCLAATPKRIAAIADRIPGLSSVAIEGEAIREYGHSHRLDDQTTFRSRLRTDELVRADQTRSTNASALLDPSRDASRDLPTSISPVDDPFGYEFRIHVSARDRNLAEARKLEPGSPAYRTKMTAAFRENLILERAFGETLARSSFAWRPVLRERVEAAQDPDAVYYSPVVAHLITRVSENLLRMMLLVVALALLAADFVLGRGGPTRPQPPIPSA
jgi:hypothetical protein